MCVYIYKVELCFITTLLFDCLFQVLVYLYSFKVINYCEKKTTEICSRTSIIDRLKSQKWLRQNGFSYVNKAIPGSLFPGTPNLSGCKFMHIMCNLFQGYGIDDRK